MMSISLRSVLNEYLSNFAWTPTYVSNSFHWSLGNQETQHYSQSRMPSFGQHNQLVRKRWCNSLQRVVLSHRHLEEQATSWSAARSCKTFAKFTTLMRSREDLEFNIDSHYRLSERCVSAIASNISGSNHGYQSTRNIAVPLQTKRFVYRCSKNDAALWLLSFLFARPRKRWHSNRRR